MTTSKITRLNFIPGTYRQATLTAIFNDIVAVLGEDSGPGDKTSCEWVFQDAEGRQAAIWYRSDWLPVADVACNYSFWGSKELILELLPNAIIS